MNARLELAEGIQECLETVQDIKACNQEEDYLRKLDAKMDAAEKAQISSAGGLSVKDWEIPEGDETEQRELRKSKH